MRGMETKPEDQPLEILEKIDTLVKSTTNFPSLLDTAEKNSIISNLEKHTIILQFGNEVDQVKVFYILLNAKTYPADKVVNLLNSSGNENAASLLQERKDSTEDWAGLRKIITNNIDRLSSHTMNLGLVLCFASGIGLISGKDREVIANYSTLEIDQLKKFYVTVAGKDDDAYDKLLKVLKMTNNNWALTVLGL